ncbi:FAD-dependent oxidoreductase [Desulfitobacterium hafniense]|uniref:FAD-dependent oxidoreductase n=1 Tax=Desulfitobacterium hafniense TaxID=49338 RepID=UPI00037F7856|nr:FAD-dependent oxidoreductase [Desulfitobacterium hafniense]
MKNNLSRRDFLKGASAAALGVASVGFVAGCSPAESAPAASTPAAPEAPSGGGSSWKTPQNFSAQAADAGSYDVVVVGHGYAGVCAARELAEQGKKVALIERQAEDTYAALGNESAGINSKLVNKITKGNQYKDIDPVEYYQNWATITGNQINPDLVMKYCQTMGGNIDWYYDSLTDADIASLTHTGSPAEGETWPHLLPNIGPIKFYPGVISAYAQECNQTKIQGYNREKAKAAGAEFFFATRGLQIVQENGAITGVIAQSMTDNSYKKYGCKAVVVATGGFADNQEMLNDLMPDIANNLTEGEEWKNAFGGARFANPGAAEASQYQGDGIKMAHWAGAHLESIVAGMNAKHIQAPSSMNNFPQAVWVRSNGKRFQNEFYPVVEQRGVPNVYMAHDEMINCVFDSDFAEYRQYTVPQHGMFSPSKTSIESIKESMKTAYEKFKGAYVAPADSGAPAASGPFAPVEFIADDTLEGLAGQLGLAGDAISAFVEQIGRYNKYCEQGFDEEFGRHKEVLFPVKKAPFYAVAGNPGLGEVMCTCGGIITDADQNALDANFKPIPGLYVSGNDCGRRFGVEYITPTPGVSLGMAITLGRECGKSVARYLG